MGAKREPEGEQWRNPGQGNRRRGPLVLLLATIGVAAHQLHSWVTEPGERNAGAAYLALTGLTALSVCFFPSGREGQSPSSVGALPRGGAVGAHLVQIVREGRVPSASETAILNLGGAAFLLTCGISLLRSQREEAE